MTGPRALLPPGTLRKLGGYVLTGGAAAVVDLGGFVALSAAGVAVMPAAAASFLVAAVVNYAASSRFVFGAALSLRRLAAFVAIATLGFAVNVGVTAALALWAGVPPPLAKLIAIGTAFGLNFVLNLLVVFRPGRAR